MTSELRPAVEVWRKAFETWAGEPEHDNAPEAAAAVIEAYGEAVRAPLLAEIERLNALADEQARYANVKKDEVRGLTAELAKYKALAEDLAGAGAAIIKLIGPKDCRLYASDPEVVTMVNILRQYKESRDD